MSFMLNDRALLDFTELLLRLRPAWPSGTRLEWVSVGNFASRIINWLDGWVRRSTSGLYRVADRAVESLVQLGKQCGTTIWGEFDSTGYVVEQCRAEMEVLFTLLAERYERGSMLLTSNHPFSQWEQNFKDAMTTPRTATRRLTVAGN